MNYSILMSVYRKEKADYFRQSIDSILAQTVKPNDFVLVCDGPLTDELDAVIAYARSRLGDTLNVIRLKQNGGLGNALNIGLAACRNELVARMDSDDISLPNRCALQLRAFETETDLDICSGTLKEFSLSPDESGKTRRLPEKHADILAFAKKRNPFNHPCVMYKKSAVLAAGSYRDFYLLEDYYLWVRMLQNGSKGRNLSDTILYMRAGSAMYKRRSGLKYARSQIRLMRYMRQSGFISFKEYIVNAVSRVAASLMPNGLRKLLFEKLLRK